MIDKMVVQGLKHKLDEMIKEKSTSKMYIENVIMLAEKIIRLEMLIDTHERSVMMFIDDEGELAFPSDDQELYSFEPEEFKNIVIEKSCKTCAYRLFEGNMCETCLLFSNWDLNRKDLKNE